MNVRLLLVSLAFLSTAFAEQGRLLLRTSEQAIGRVAAAHDLDVVARVDGAGKQVYVVTPRRAASRSALLAALQSNPSIAAVEPDATVALSGPRLNQSTVAILDGAAAALSQSRYSAYLTQPAVSIIGLPNAQRMATGAGIVAIIDTGVDANHPVLAGSVVPGYDFTRDAPGFASDVADLDQSTVAILDQSTVAILDQSTVAILDQSTVAILDQSTVAILDGRVPAAFGHGTMVAGLVHLVAPTAKIMPLKAFNADGSARLSDIVRAVYYAVDSGAKVINMSFSMRAPSPELAAAIAYANSKRVIVVSSVANDGAETRVYPAALKRALGVGSTTNYDVRSTFSNYGKDSVSLAAPGEALVTTYPFGRYAVAWGTSFSTALVSGAGALLAQLNPSLNQGGASSALSRAVPLPRQELGWGRLEASWACAYARAAGDGDDE